MSGSNGHRNTILRVEVTPYERPDGRQEARIDLVDGAGRTVASLGWWTALSLASDLTKALAMLRESTVETAGRVVHDMRRDAAGDLR